MSKRDQEGCSIRVKSDNKQRVCLRCDKSFKSTGPGNRICTKCNAANEHARDGVNTLIDSRYLADAIKWFKFYGEQR